MKNYIKCLMLGLLIFCVSCSDFLNKNPLDQITSQTFWQSEAEAAMGLAGVYSRLLVSTFNHNDGRFDTMGGECCMNQSQACIAIAQGNIEATSGDIVTNTYNQCFSGIGACNFFLDNIEKAPLPAATLNRYKAEVQFLRALFYSVLVDHYGGVPLYSTSVTIDEAKVRQSPKSEVLNQIYADLDFAIANLPNTAYSDGHAVRGSAQALKARVLLYNSEWQSAADMANQVIQSGVFSLTDNFRTLFLASGQNNNPEIIFSTRYRSPDITMDLDVRWSWHGIINPRQELVDAYECTDGLSITQSPLYDPDSWLTNRDPRLALTIKRFGETAVNSAGQTVVFSYNGPSITGFNPVKYCNWDVLPIDYSTLSEQDWILIRYADVLLMYAEARNEASGPDASVYDAINQIRTRAGMPALPEGLSKDQMRERIRNERRVELALEGLRWSDILRWKTAETYIPTLIDGEGGAQRRFDPAKHYLLPFPQSEIDVNDQLQQNPGY